MGKLNNWWKWIHLGKLAMNGIKKIKNRKVGQHGSSFPIYYIFIHSLIIQLPKVYPSLLPLEKNWFKWGGELSYLYFFIIIHYYISPISSCINKLDQTSHFSQIFTSLKEAMSNLWDFHPMCNFPVCIS